MSLTITRPRSGHDAQGALSRLVRLFEGLGEVDAVQGAREAMARCAAELNDRTAADASVRAVEAEQARLLAHGETTLEAASLAVAAAKVGADPEIRGGLLRGARTVLALDAWAEVTADADGLVKVLRNHHDGAVKAMVGAVDVLPPSGFEPETRDHRGRQAWQGMLAGWVTLGTARKGWYLLVETGALAVPRALVKAADHPSELVWTAESDLSSGFAGPGAHPARPHPARLAAERMARGTATAWLPSSTDLRRHEADLLAALEAVKKPLPHPFARGALTA